MSKDLELRKQMGERIRKIRNELKLNKEALGREIGVTGQFLGVVESGRSTISYDKLKKLCEISGYSADYILFGKDANVVKETKIELEKYSDEQIKSACDVIQKLALFMKNGFENESDDKNSTLDDFDNFDYYYEGKKVD